MYLEILLLQVTENFFVSRHVKGSTTIKIPHRSQCTLHLACNQWKVKLKLCGQRLTSYKSSNLLVLLLLWTISSKMSMLVTVKKVTLDMSYLFLFLYSYFQWNFFPFPFFSLAAKAQSSSSSFLDEDPSLVFYLNSSYTIFDHSHSQYGSFSLPLTESW